MIQHYLFNVYKLDFSSGEPVFSHHLGTVWLKKPSESVSDNSETTQLLSHECRTISKNFRENFFLVLKSRFLPIWEVFDFWCIFYRSEKKMKFLTSNAPKNFLGIRYTCSRYLQCPPTLALSNAPTLVIIRHRDKMVQEKQKTRTSPGLWISLL